MPDGGDRPANSVATATGHASQALLQIWLSPAFPVGAFAYSHGLEKAIEFAWINDRATLESWVRDLLAHGSVRNDLILLASAWTAVNRDDTKGLAAAAELSVAFQPSAERHLETTQQGASFLTQIEQAWPCAGVKKLRSVADGAVGYPVALAAAAAGHGVPLAEALRGYAIAFVSNLASAAVRLSIIGQSDAQRVIAATLPEIESAVRLTSVSTLDDLGGAAFRSDIASLAHETQYTRLFRS